MTGDGLHDEWAVQQVITRYSQLTGRGDWDPVIALFLPDATWEIPHLNLVFTGAEAIRGALAGLAADFAYVLQLNAPALIAVAGDRATARSAIREAGRLKSRPGAEDRGFEFLGIYADELARTPAGWKFRTRVFEHVGTQHWPLVPAG
jgi:ketosteroid isomerase-like protein